MNFTAEDIRRLRNIQDYRADETWLNALIAKIEAAMGSRLLPSISQTSAQR